MWRRSPALAASIGLAVLVLSGCGGDQTKAGGETATAPSVTLPPSRVSGEEVYGTRCAPCHGAEGHGDGPAAASITPKPRNFRDRDFWKGRNPEQLRLVVREGKPGTLMPPFEGALDKEQIDAVVAYIQTFRPAAP
jgi:mono/diheme cytochrome c family protein